MDGLTALAFALKALESAPAIIQGAASLAEGLAKMNDYTIRLRVMIAEDRNPHPFEWDALNADLDALEMRLNS